MKLLLLFNQVNSDISDDIGIIKPVGGGWLDLYPKLIADTMNADVCVLFPINEKGRKYEGDVNNYHYISFYENPKKYHVYYKSMESEFKSILNDINPDIVHIWGTEYAHSLAMIKAFNNPKKTIISIQGLISECARHYCDYLPKRIIYGFTLRDLLRFDNIFLQKKRFHKRGIFEIESIRRVDNVIGRTSWDKKKTNEINSSIKYFHCDEILRREFYENEWSYESCKKHRIFISQGSYPLKAVDRVIKVMPALREKYSDVQLIVAGSGFNNSAFISKLKHNSYEKYIFSLIKKYNLEKQICFVGNLNCKQIIENYKESNVYILPSTVENSSNSLCEAMMLGVPCIASNVGGNPSIMNSNNEYLLFELSSGDDLFKKICKVFDMPQNIIEMTIESKHCTKERHDIAKCITEYIYAYNQMLKEEIV